MGLLDKVFRGSPLVEVQADYIGVTDEQIAVVMPKDALRGAFVAELENEVLRFGGSEIAIEGKAKLIVIKEREERADNENDKH